MDTVISSRVRLARNIDSSFFLNKEQATALSKNVYDILKNVDKFNLKKIIDLSSGERMAMVERHLISPDLIKNPYGAAIISDDESISIMINEEDHLREQCILKGLSLDQAYGRVNLIDKELSCLNFAFTPQKGYLTSCLTNVGTGMRASVMMFLPALTLTKTIEECFSGVMRLGMAIRGIYGEGSDSGGFVFQISNQRTLGITEKEILSAVNSVAVHITNAELKAREIMMRTSAPDVKDKILRSFGTLCNCFKLSYKEFIHSIAFIKLGIHYELLKCTDYDKIEELVVRAGPAGLSLKGGLLPEERDIYRASLVSKEIKQNISLRI